MSHVAILDGVTKLQRELLGGKAYGVNRMMALGLPVPPAFSLLTSVEAPEDAWGDVKQHVLAMAEGSGTVFGGSPPLLLSVRSGAPVSMPGMMDTILNVGLTEEVIQYIAEENRPLAIKLKARLQNQFQGIDNTALATDAWSQLRLAVDRVKSSWNSPRAVDYRARHGIPDSMGTAVTIQKMVLGNRDMNSGTGVVYTRNPNTGGSEPLGEWIPCAQGEDVVSGTVSAHSIATMQTQLPSAFERLKDACTVLETDRRCVQDIEFTVESGELWLLQTRDAKLSDLAAIRHTAAFVRAGLIDTCEAAGRLRGNGLAGPGRQELRTSGARTLATGRPAAPGIGRGVAVLHSTPASNPRRNVLVRETTEPDDVPMMATAAAVVTERGGATSHAAIVCRELAIPCVVGCGQGVREHLVGKQVTVDATKGVIYEGNLPPAPDITSDDPDFELMQMWLRKHS